MVLFYNIQVNYLTSFSFSITFLLFLFKMLDHINFIT